MASITIERSIEAPAERVFQAATDFAGAPERIAGILRMEVLTEGPVGPGTRFRETRKMFGKEATEEMEIVTFEPPRGYAVRAESHGCRYHTEFRFVPEGSGTRASMVFDAQPVSFMAKVMSVLMRPMLKACAKEMEKDMDDLKRSLE